MIEVERRGYPPTTLSPALLQEGVFLPAITVSELLVGVYRASDPNRRARRQVFVEGIIAQIPVIPFDLVAARIHGRLAAGLRAGGTTIGANDLLIAATALAHGHPVLTMNPRDFGRVPGLAVHQPGW